MKKKELIGINIVDLYYCEKSQIINYLYTLGLDNEYCILSEKGIEKYLNEASLILGGFKVNGPCFNRNDCNPVMSVLWVVLLRISMNLITLRAVLGMALLAC